MKFRIVASTMALSLSMLALGVQAHAAPASALSVPVHALFGKSKMINVKVENKTQTVLTIQAGDQTITVQPGATGSLKLTAGTQITSVNATATLTAGTVIATATSNLNDSTLTVN